MPNIVTAISIISSTGSPGSTKFGRDDPRVEIAFIGPDRADFDARRAGRLGVARFERHGQDVFEMR